MKPKYSRYLRKALPSLIILPAMIQFASADPRPTEPDGSLTIPPNAPAAADTIIADGADPGEVPNLLVTVGTGAIITGDPVLQNAVIVTADGYTIDNSGRLSGDAEGILAGTANDLTIFNVFAPTAGGSSITGGTDGIVAGDGFILVNGFFASVTGNNGLGLFSGDETSVFNDPDAIISGTLGGILAGDDAEITNDGNIFGNTGPAIDLGNNAFVENTGLIIGDTGIIATSSGLTPLGLELINSGEIRSTAAGPFNDAVIGSVVDDSITLNAGSLIVGNLFGDTGTDTLTFNGGLGTPGGVSNAVRGDVDSFSTITKNGGGVAFIGTPDDVGTGLNVFADTINITPGDPVVRGGLYINADIGPDTALITTINANGAALGGTGFWNANINVLRGGFSAGAIPINLDAVPENSVGSVQVAGNVVHSPGSFIRVDIVPDTVINEGINSDIIDQIGGGFTYNVTGTNIRISPTSLDKVITPGTYTIVDSDAPIVGFNSLGALGVQFNPNITSSGVFSPSGSGSDFRDSVLTTRFTTPTLGDGGTNLQLEIEYDFENLPGSTENQQSFGAALDALAATQPGLGDAEQDFIAALALSDVDTVQDVLTAVGPEGTFAITNSIINSNYRVNRMVQDRLAASRSAVDEMVISRTTVGSMGMSEPSQPSQTTMSSSSKSTFWGSVSGDKQDFEGSNGLNDYDGDVGAITAGYEHRFNSTFMIGGLFDGSSADLDGADIESVRFAVYGTYGQSLGFYSDFLAGYGSHDFDQNSNILGANFRSDTDADSFQALLTAGYAMGSETLKHGPFIGLEYQNLDVDGFDRAGGGLNLTVDGYDVESLRGLIGYRVNSRYGAFSPYASVAYAHEFDGDGENVNATFGGAPFTVRGDDLESAILVTAGTGFDITNNLLLDIGYRGEISVEDEGLTSHGASIGLSYSF